MSFHRMFNTRLTDEISGLSGLRAGIVFGHPCAESEPLRWPCITMSTSLFIARYSFASRVLRSLLPVIAVFGFVGGNVFAADEVAPAVESISSGAADHAHAEHAAVGIPLRALPARA